MRNVMAGNWKMHKTASETRAFLDAFLPMIEQLPNACDIVVAPPFTALGAAHDRLREQPRVALGAQNMHWELQGAYTGEISPTMLLEHGVRYVILGHSERRASNNEQNSTVNLKTKSALAHGLTPIVAVGETDEERSAGRTDERVIEQTREALDGIARSSFEDIVLAYEPVWAIGTGNNCDAEEADRVMGVIRGCVGGLDETPILYGGSMKPDNAAAYLARPNINGGLIGGASLDPTAFFTLVRLASGA